MSQVSKELTPEKNMKFKPRKSNICILNSEKQTVTGGKLYFTPKFISSTNVFEGLEWDGWIWYAERAKVDFRASELHHIKLNLNLKEYIQTRVKY